MRVLLTGVCGFVGSNLACALREWCEGIAIVGIDNLLRPGSEGNRAALEALEVKVFHGDIRMASDLEALPPVDWVIDAAANPSVLAGVDGRTSSRQLVEHNLLGTVNLLEFCKAHRAGFVLISTSRVYSIPALAALPMRVEGQSFVPDVRADRAMPPGFSREGIAEDFPTSAPVSLYGATKLASETLALDYGSAFGFPVWIDRCGVLAGAGQFGKIDQGIFSFWLHSWRERRPLRYIGFGGKGHQARDLFHPVDLARVVLRQIEMGSAGNGGVFNLGGGAGSSVSLARLSAWCARRWPENASVYPGLLDPRDEEPGEGAGRPFDIPWFVMNSGKALANFGWAPEKSAEQILEEIANFADAHPDWMRMVAR